MMTQFVQQDETAESKKALRPLNTRAILQIMRKGRFLILESVVLFILLGLAYIHTQSRLYTAMAIVAPQESSQANIQSGTSALQALGSLSGVSLGKDGSALDEFLGTLDTPVVAAGMQSHYGILQKVFAGSWDSVKHRWRPPPRRFYSGAINSIMGMPQPGPPNIFSLAGYVTQYIKKTKDRDTSFITLRYSNPDPKFATYFLRTLCMAADEAMRDAAKRRAAVNVEFLQEKLKTVQSADLRQALIAMLEDQERTLMLANSGETYAFRFVQPPITSDSPTWPASKKILEAAIALGLIFGFAVSAFLYWFVQGQVSRFDGFRQAGSLTAFLVGRWNSRRA